MNPKKLLPNVEVSSSPFQLLSLLLLGFFTHYLHLTWSHSNLSASQESQKPWLLFTAGCTTWETYLESLVSETLFLRQLRSFKDWSNMVQKVAATGFLLFAVQVWILNIKAWGMPIFSLQKQPECETFF